LQRCRFCWLRDPKQLTFRSEDTRASSAKHEQRLFISTTEGRISHPDLSFSYLRHGGGSAPSAAHSCGKTMPHTTTPAGLQLKARPLSLTEACSTLTNSAATWRRVQDRVENYSVWRGVRMVVPQEVRLIASYRGCFVRCQCHETQRPRRLRSAICLQKTKTTTRVSIREEGCGHARRTS